VSGTILVQTSCGQQFEVRADELTDSQLRGLLEENLIDADPRDIAALIDEMQKRAIASSRGIT
jgi:hypothetical protein